jgi:hypothetical protein
MPRSVKQIADEVVTYMRMQSCDVITMRWPKFYEVCGRNRIKQAFIEALSAQLKMESILLMQGNAVVAFVKDFDFSPMR